jgi:predicted metal-dependent phosphoesterase TrpH
MGTDLTSIRADLHVHTALSPCASEEMTPPVIVATAKTRGLGMIAVSDHNTVGNVGATQEAALAAGGSLVVLAGMEITSAEEVHVLGLFPDLSTAEGVAARIRAYLPTADADYYAFFGEQTVLGADGFAIATETASLALATPLNLNQTVALVHSAGGLAIAAHVDRKSFGVLSQLGFFPSDAGFDGIEVSRHTRLDSSRLSELAGLGLPLSSASDSHFPDEIGTAATDFLLQEATFTELVLAFTGAEGRTLSIAEEGSAIHA